MPPFAGGEPPLQARASLAAPSVRQSKGVKKSMPPRNIAADADAFLQSEAKAGRFRGAVLLALQGEVLLRAGYGLANEHWI